MELGIPQIIYIVLTCVGLGMEFSRHGEPKKGTHNGWVSLIASGLILGILYWGGFFG